MEAGTANKYRELFYLFHQEGQLDTKIAETILEALAANNQNAIIASMASKQLELIFEQKGGREVIRCFT